MRSEIELLELIQDEIVLEAVTIRDQVLMEGHAARDVRIGVLLAVADLIAVAKRITKREEEEDE